MIRLFVALAIWPNLPQLAAAHPDVFAGAAYLLSAYVIWRDAWTPAS